MYVYICIAVRDFLRFRKGREGWLLIHTYMYARTHIHTFTYTHSHIHTYRSYADCIGTRRFRVLEKRERDGYSYIHTCVYIHTYTYIYIHIHTHIHIYIHKIIRGLHRHTSFSCIRKGRKRRLFYCKSGMDRGCATD
jgi:hypothetical protein